MRGFLICSFLLEFPFCKYLCIWITCICWDMEIWEMVGLWHYPVPGFFLLAQFCLGILVALGNLVSNSVFLYLSDEDGRSSNDNCTVEERKIALYLSAIGQKFLSMYRSFGTYIAFLTILIMVYQVRPKYVSFGYIFLRLFWITGRQLVEKTKQRLWFPLKAYAVVVFIFIYSLSIFPSFEMWLSGKIDLSNLGHFLSMEYQTVLRWLLN